MKDDGDYEIVDHVEPSNRAWLEWKALVENEGWTSDDLSVLTLTPRLSSTRIVLARKRSGENKLSAELFYIAMIPSDCIALQTAASSAQ